jgi:hypothetical protein
MCDLRHPPSGRCPLNEGNDCTVKKQPHYKILSGLAILMVVSSLLTILPYPAASKANLLGYKSLCAFVPLSTLILLGAAGFVRIFRDTQSKTRGN